MFKRFYIFGLKAFIAPVVIRFDAAEIKCTTNNNGTFQYEACVFTCPPIPELWPFIVTIEAAAAQCVLILPILILDLAVFWWLPVNNQSDS